MLLLAGLMGMMALGATALAGIGPDDEEDDGARAGGQFLDFAPGEDTLLLVYDDSADSDPQVGIAPDPEDADTQHVMLNGTAIAAIKGAPALDAGHIALVGSSPLPPGAPG